MGVRALAVAAVAIALAGLHVSSRPTTLCTLRALTGVPCPLCGGTTALVGLGRGDVSAAFRASPLVMIGGLLMVLAPLRNAVSSLRERSPRLGQPAVLLLAAAAAGASELWQLQRFGLL